MNIQAIVFFIGLGGAILGFLILFVLVFSQRYRDFCKIPIKNGVRKIRCGGRFDYVTLSFPFVEFGISDDFLSVKYSQTEFIIEYSEIKDVRLNRGIFSTGIEIFHDRKDISNKITIWTPYSIQIKDLIEKRLAKRRK